MSDFNETWHTIFIVQVALLKAFQGHRSEVKVMSRQNVRPIMADACISTVTVASILQLVPVNLTSMHLDSGNLKLALCLRILMYCGEIQTFLRAYNDA